jgi:hypothetical protein
MGGIRGGQTDPVTGANSEGTFMKVLSLLALLVKKVQILTGGELQGAIDEVC